ncbi:LacI family DNA-binding transcriptional regulator [Acidisoma cellulosilytica]|uniref:LacI family DNA-binding transcriptional regulator n=1 Tax=Acidisoma cellulosilyticum TaxID=2802395 RepID=A0A963Z2C6_9PROT|nr:LacI family DNA-binding transcriptional regulator [Acidisoma cellulosilyticum]MCB8881449.1 LacI family DNA-binding transcriptional regulator [Acidisoma cellulosilyticum]
MKKPSLIPHAQAGASGIRDLAARLGISIGTVSRALNDKPDVNPETRKRVIAAASELGYVPQQSGRSLRKGATHNIGLLWEIPEGRAAYGEPFFLSLFGGTQQVLSARGYDLVIMPDQPGATADPLARLRRIIQQRQVDALILPWTRTMDPRLDYLAEVGIPFVALGRSRSGGPHPWIDLDFEQAGEFATARFIAAGHRRIAIAIPADSLMQKRFFLAGYRRALKAAGLPFERALVAEGHVTPAGGYAAATRLLDVIPRPTAMLAIDSSMAVGIYRRLAELGLSCGQDVAVIGGVHDTPMTEFLVPALTCFSLDTVALGRRLAEILLARLDSKANPAGELWPIVLVERQSDRID